MTEMTGGASAIGVDDAGIGPEAEPVEVGPVVANRENAFISREFR
jgi:hypothetical protein